MEFDSHNPDTNSQKSQQCCARWSRLKVMAVAALIVTAITLIVVVPTVVSLSSSKTRQETGQDLANSPLKVAAFNIKTFGVAKMSNSTIAERVVQIIGRSHILLIQEVRDKSGSSLQTLKSLLGHGWNYIASDRIGRTSYKEQYVFFYRTQHVKVTRSYQYNDTEGDVFEREPFSIEIQYYSKRHDTLRHVVLLGFHSKPEDTPSELAHLAGVIETVNNHFVQSDGVIAMGDFNADCNYLNRTSRDTLDIFNSNKGFISKIGDSIDTTVSQSTDCAYDRVVVYGDVGVRNAHVYNFEKAMGLNEEEARAVSDHYPVEFLLH